MVHPPLSIQTLYDNEFQNRFQGETAQSMFERLSRLFEESDVNNLFLLKYQPCKIYCYYYNCFCFILRTQIDPVLCMVVMSTALH